VALPGPAGIRPDLLRRRIARRFDVVRNFLLWAVLSRLAAMVLAMPGAVACLAAPVEPAAIPKILAHGPWPVTLARDPSNRVSGRAASIEFGYRMFREPRFSPNGYMACISCHQTDRAFTDAVALAQGLAPVGRNTPSLANLRLMRWFGWDGASDSLWMASLRPILDAREIGSDAGHVAQVVRTGDGHACRYRRSFGTRPTSDDDLTVLINVAKALAAFAETLVTGPTPFDRFRDALAQGDEVAAARYPAEALRGVELFVGKGQCARCHSGANFSDGEFHQTGRGDRTTLRLVDAGREDGLARWRLSAFNRYSRLGGAREDLPASNRSPIGDTSHRGEFRTPSLRNVALTPPYMHDGHVDTLQEAVTHHALGVDLAGSLDDQEPVPRPAALSGSEIADLVAFLETLTDARGAARRFPALEPSPCR
jgi:cytochrome c peroxidase